ncbi:MAG: PqqD family protein [Flavobacteriales bacterium]|nr:PqqD family protein [Flavobacteriales bacterium]|tara:strand:- start:429 stop:692 length:264 start_codon:yes stop_codon:yes gene_type:complete
MKNKLSISKDCVAERLDDELIILNLSTGMYHNLNLVGIIIWEEIQRTNPSIEILIEQLQQRFDSASIESDVQEFVNDLLMRKLITKE